MIGKKKTTTPNVILRITLMWFIKLSYNINFWYSTKYIVEKNYSNETREAKYYYTCTTFF